jgi:hypothetical protein
MQIAFKLKFTVRMAGYQSERDIFMLTVLNKKGRANFMTLPLVFK